MFIYICVFVLYIADEGRSKRQKIKGDEETSKDKSRKEKHKSHKSKRRSNEGKVEKFTDF